MSASNKDNKDFDNSDDSISREYIDPNNKQKWSSNKKVIEDKWLEPMHLVLVTLQYLNDCLRAGLVYRREFYTDSEIEPEDSLMFKITLTPFGSINTNSFNK